MYCTMPGKSGFDERHPSPWALAVLQPADRPTSGCKSLDLLLALGSSLTRTGYGQPIPGGKIMIHNTESLEDRQGLQY